MLSAQLPTLRNLIGNQFSKKNAGGLASMSAVWTERYPRLGETIPQCAELVASLRESLSESDGVCELEARLGRVHEHRFCAGVTRKTMDTIIEMMQDSPFVVGDDEWVEHQDFLYTIDDTPHRTRVSYSADDMQATPTTIVKRPVQKVDILTGGEFDIRVAVKREISVPNPEMCVTTDRVRIKQHRRFKTRCGTWCFDFALVWSGRTKTEAERKQCSSDPEFEIECELLEPTRYLALHDDAYVATSLLLKMCDLVEDGKHPFVLHTGSQQPTA